MSNIAPKGKPFPSLPTMQVDPSYLEDQDARTPDAGIYHDFLKEFLASRGNGDNYQGGN